MKKLGAWLIKTSHAIARWFGKIKKNCMCWWNKILHAITFTMEEEEKECNSPICTCKK